MLTLILLKAGVAGVTGLDGMDGLDGVAGATGLDGTLTEDTVPVAGEDTIKDKTSVEEAKNTTSEIKNRCKFSYKF